MNSFERFNEDKLPAKNISLVQQKKGKIDNNNKISDDKISGLSWDAMLKMTGTKLEKISDIDQYLFIEKGTRGGISYIAKRYAKANNKYMNDYDPEKPSTFITYLDKNNLYGWSMSEYLPYGEFNWLKNVDELDIVSINKKSDIGYFLEVDLDYPDELHELHNDYPLASEKTCCF